MNWPDLNEIHKRALSGEMTVKEASDLISQIWWLIRSHSDWKDVYISNPSPEYPDFREEHRALLDLCTDVYKVMHTPEREPFLKGWLDTIPTELKAIEAYKKLHKDKFTP